MADQGILSEQHPLRVLLGVIPDAAILVDQEGNIAAANEQAVSLLGWPADDLEGLALETLIPGRVREGHARHVARFLETPEVRPMGAELELRALHRDGSEIPVLISLRPLIDKGMQFVVAAIRDISRQCLLQEELRASEELFRIAAGLTADLVQTVDLEHDLIQPHGDIDGLMGYPQGEFPRSFSGWFALIHPDDRDRIETEVSRLIETGAKEWRFDYRIRSHDGSYHHWIDSGVVTNFCEDGSIRNGIGVTRDVTAQVEAREALDETIQELRKKDQQFQIFAASASEILQTVVIDQNLIVHHGDVDGLLGYPQGEFPSTLDGWIEFIHPDDRDRIVTEVDRVVATGAKTWELKYRIPDADGVYRHWHENGVVTDFAEDGTANVGIGSIRDVTKEVVAQQELKRTLSELAASEALLKSMFLSIPDHIAVIDPTGTIVAVNPSWTRFAEENGARQSANLGVGGDYLGVCSSAADDDPEVAEINAGIRSVLEGSLPIFKADYSCHSPSEERWFMMTVTPLQTDTGGALISHRDITQRIQARTQLESSLAEVESLKDRLAAENVYLQNEIRSDRQFDQIIGESDPWIRVLEQVGLVAGSDSTVLLTGETGTGKELIARAVHAKSQRGDHPLIKVNCAALPATLIESELFGHSKGAFTGADAKRQGKFALADGGTIFLDEIGELPLELQSKLLHVLQDGEFEPLGSATAVRVDVRVIAATNRDLQASIRKGQFRSDLYYRVAIFPIELPPLRDRGDDIPLLASYFLTLHNAKHGRAIKTIGGQTMEAMLRYDWPGNVRELQNLIERGVLIARGNSLELERHLLLPSRDLQAADAPDSESSTSRLPAQLSTGNLRDIERAHITAVLEACDWKVKGKGNAAESLGLKESTLRSRMKKLGIRRPS